MKKPLHTSSASRGFYLVFCVIAALGIYLRLDQFTVQVLLDDEWHVIHQLLAKTPTELVQTFGIADFSIPLALLYWVELTHFGLSEFGMRWPMMLAGCLFLCLAPLYVRRYFNDSVALVFMLLIAMSPSLIIYSKTARPYAITLLLSLLAITLFQNFVRSEKTSFKWGALYLLCAIASSWLHLVTLALVVSPFAVYGIPALFNGDRKRVARLFKLGLVTLAGLLLVLLPPLLGHPEDLTIKLGEQLPGMSSYYGMLFFWMGTGSASLVLIGVLLAIIGAGPTWRQLPLITCLLTGLVFTLFMILMTQPAWVHHSLTLTRYLLAAMPLFLLATASGVMRVNDELAARWGRKGQSIAAVVFFSLFVFWVSASPLPKVLTQPNSNSLHAAYQFDYREEENLVLQYQKDFPVSPFWKILSSFPAGSIKITATPFSFETHHWDAARWEQISHQRVMPGFLTGFCDGHWWGEVPRDGGYRFRNTGYLADRVDLIARGFDLLVYQRPVRAPEVAENQGFALTAAHCEPKIREHYGKPVYEDRLIVVFSLSDNIRALINAKR